MITPEPTLVLSRAPKGTFLHCVADDSAEPAFHAGEWLVIDPSQTEPVEREPVLIEWSNGHRAVVQIGSSVLGEGKWIIRDLATPHDPAERNAYYRRWFASTNAGHNPPPLRTCTGPIGTDHLQEKIVGRVIGVFRSSEPVLPALPVPAE